MLVEKAIKMASQLVMLILFARFLGPEKMGDLMLCFALSSMFIFLNGLGLDSLLVKKIIDRPKKRTSYLKHALIARIGAACTCVLFVNFVGLWIVEDDSRKLLLIISLYHLFMPFTVFEWFFQSEGRGDLSAFGLICGHLAGFVCRLMVLFFEGDLVWLGAAYILEMFVMALVYCAIAWRYKLDVRGPFSIRRASDLVVDAAPLILAGAVILLYMKMDQIMLGHMKGAAEVGVYVAASRLSEAWYFVGLTLIGVYFPKLLQLLKSEGDDMYRSQIVDMGRWLILAAVVLSCVTSMYSHALVDFLYGPEFARSAAVLAITIWCVPFVFLGGISTRIYVAKGLHNVVLYRSLFGLTLNLGLNFLLIPRYSVLGAAVSTLLAQVLSSYVSNLWLGGGERVFQTQTRLILFFQWKRRYRL